MLLAVKEGGKLLEPSCIGYMHIGTTILKE